MKYTKKEVIELAEQVLGSKLDPNAKFIPEPILERLGLYREWGHYIETASERERLTQKREARNA